MSHYRVRRDGIEFPVAGTEALLRLVHEGSLSPTDRVFEPERSAWRAAGSLEVLAPAFAARDSAAEARRNLRPRVRPPTLPGAPAAPVASGPIPAAFDPDAPTPQPARPLFEIPTDLLPPPSSPPDPAPPAADPVAAQSKPGPPVADAGGRVLAFPGSKPLPGLAGALDPARARAALEDPASFLRGAREEPPARGPLANVRPALIVMTIAVCAIGALLVVSWVEHASNQQFARASGVQFDEVAPAADPSTQPSSGGPSAEAQADAFYEQMELSLRNRMVSGCSTIEREDDLDTALRIELSRLGVQVQSIHAPVLTWGGRHGDVPLAVEIKIWYEGHADQLDRELGAIGLVVGKYAQNYSLDVRSFELLLQGADGGARKRDLDPAAARQFYMRRISMLEFLKAEAG